MNDLQVQVIISAVIDGLKDELNKAQQELKQTEQTAKKSGANIGKAMAAAGKAVAAGLKAAVTAVAAIGTSLVAVAETTREFRTEQAMLMTAFEGVGGSAEMAKQTYEDLYSVLGDSGKATEAALHLAQLTNDEKALAEYTNILTGVYAKFGDSLPTEGLAEAINHSAKLGEVQGVLADALEWSGVNLDDFNTMLFECNTEAEREALIRDTLNGLYADAGDAYKQNAADIIEANKAQLAMTEGLAACGATVEPLITLFKSGLANALQGVVPGLQELSGGLQDVINGVEGGQERMTAAFQNIVDSVLNTITTALPMILQVGFDILEALIVGITEALPSVLQTLSDLLPQVISTIGELIPMITGAILDSLPLIIETLLQAVAQILVELGNILPEIVMQIVAIIPQIVDALVANIPVLLDAAITFLMAIVDALPTIITALLAELPGIIDAILNSLSENIPVLIEAAIQLFMAIVEAIPEILPALVEAIPQIIDSILTFFIDNFPTLLAGGIDFFLALVESIPEIIPDLIVALGDILATIGTDLVDKAPECWDSMMKGITDVFENIDKKFEEWFGDAWTSIKDAFAEVGSFFEGLWNDIKSKFEDIGSKIGDAVGGAFNTAINWVLEKAIGIINGFIDTINGAIGIINKIPGVNINKIDRLEVPQLEKGGVLEKGQVGLLEGNGAEAVVPLERNTKWLDRLASMLTEKLSNNDFSGTGEQQIVLQVDGRTLARTSIKSINQLTKQTGKLGLLLE